MGAETGVGWTNSTFNPWWGCSHAGPGCANCYAEAWAARFGMALWGTDAPRREFGDAHWNVPRKWNEAARRSGRRHLVFTGSMCDIFDKHAPAGARERLWKLIRETPHLTWQIVTKRIGNAAKMLPDDWGDGYPNVWLISTVVNQDELDRDGPKLLSVPAVVHGISAEPLLGRLDLRKYLVPGAANDDSRPAIDWVIVGGESGSEARPMDLAWARDIREQCEEAGTAFFFKQAGGTARDKGGSLLDGVEYQQWPTAA